MSSQTLDDIKELILALAKQEQLHVTEKKGPGMTGLGIACTVVGKYLVDIPWVVAGAAMGGVIYFCMNGGFKSLSDFLLELSPEIKEKLYNGVMELLKEVVWTCLEILLKIVLNDTKLKNTIVDFIKCFFEGSLHIKVVKK